jgi:hypothetical protein
MYVPSHPLSRPKHSRSAPPQATTYLRIPTQPTSRQRDGRFTPASIAALTTALKAKPWRLLDAEVLQVLNHGPTDGEEVAMLLEDADLRFSSEQLERIAEIVVDALEVKSLTEVGAARVEVVGKGQADGGARGL